MALKPDYAILEDDITRSCAVVATRGCIAVHNVAGSGNALGDTAGTVTVSASSSGVKVAGLLWDDVVSVDETRYKLNEHKRETRLNDPVTLLTKGWCVTNFVVGTPAEGGIAYLSSSGYVTPTIDPSGGLVATPKVGKFDGKKDADGYVKLVLNLPIV